MALNRYQRFAYRALGVYASRRDKPRAHLDLTLPKAHIQLRPDVYLSFAYLTAFLVFGVTALLVAGLLAAGWFGLIYLPPRLLAFLVPAPLVLSFLLYVFSFLQPDLRAAGRARDIEAKLPYALNYISTMASAGVSPAQIFESLASQRVYGEVAHEMAWITRDMNVLGKDLVSALDLAIQRSPSARFQDFLQGTVTALTSGESLKGYFAAKSQQFAVNNRQEQKKFIDSLGIMAESYVTVVVAAPLFLVIILSVMLMFGASEKHVLNLGYLAIVGLMPIAQLLFAGIIRSITPEV